MSLLLSNPSNGSSLILYSLSKMITPRKKLLYQIKNYNLNNIVLTNQVKL